MVCGEEVHCPRFDDSETRSSLPTPHTRDVSYELIVYGVGGPGGEVRAMTTSVWGRRGTVHRRDS